MSPSPTSAPDSSRPRAGWWLTGAAGLALAVQAIFVLLPEPKSAGATDAPGGEMTAGVDSTAFTLAEDVTQLPAEAPAGPDTVAAPLAASSVTDSVAPANTGSTSDSAAPLPAAPSAAPLVQPELISTDTI